MSVMQRLIKNSAHLNLARQITTSAQTYFTQNPQHIPQHYPPKFTQFLSSLNTSNLKQLQHILLPCKPPKGFENFYTQKKEQPIQPPPPQDDKPPQKPNFSKLMWASLYVGLFTLWITNFQFISNEITYKEFLQDYLQKGYVERILVVNRDYIKAILRPGAHKSVPFVCFKVGSIDGLEPRIERAQLDMGLSPAEFIPVQYIQEISVYEQFKSVIPYILIILGLEFFMRRINIRGSSNGMGGPFSSFLNNKIKPHTSKESQKIKFSDVAGLKEAKIEITEFVEFLKDPKKFESLGARLPKGALLSGPPGGGKTLLAKAVAGEANVPFFAMSGSEFVEMFVGVGSSRVRNLFAEARKNAPSIIFIDEIDAVGRKRDSGMNRRSNEERESTLNQILVEMDGFNTSTGVVVLAGTNRADVLDPALLRPGRFDRTIEIEKPDIDDREEIFKIHLKPIKVDESTDVSLLSKRLAALTPGFSGADIANICNEGAIHAARRNSQTGVNFDDFERASERVMAGLPKVKTLISALQKRTVAYHETGHALVGWFSAHADPVLKVSILPRSKKILGFAQNLPDESFLYTKEALLDKIAVILGGRAAEELFMGSITTGAEDDLRRVTELGYSLVSRWGMNNEVGLLAFGNQANEQFYRPYSDNLAQLIDKEVKSLIDSTYSRAKQILWDHKVAVHALADLLFLKETITYHDIVECVGERPFEMKSELKHYITANPQKPLLIEPESKQPPPELEAS